MLRPASGSQSLCGLISPWSLCPLRDLCVDFFFRIFFTVVVAISFSGCSRTPPPDGANRGHYRNARIDALTDQIHVEMDQEQRKALCSEVQKILAEDLPYVPLWFSDVVSVHRRFTPSGSREGSGELNLSPTGDFDFLATLPLPNQ